MAISPAVMACGMKILSLSVFLASCTAALACPSKDVQLIVRHHSEVALAKKVYADRARKVDEDFYENFHDRNRDGARTLILNKDVFHDHYSGEVSRRLSGEIDLLYSDYLCEIYLDQELSELAAFYRSWSGGLWLSYAAGGPSEKTGVMARITGYSHYALRREEAFLTSYDRLLERVEHRFVEINDGVRSTEHDLELLLDGQVFAASVGGVIVGLSHPLLRQSALDMLHQARVEGNSP